MEIKKFGFYFLFIIITLIAVKFYTIIYDFFPSIAAGCVFAYIFNPLYVRLYKIFKRKFLSAFIIITIIFFLILVPVTLIIIALQQQMDILLSEDTLSNVSKAMDNFDTFLRDILAIDFADRFIETYIGEIVPKIINAAQKTITYLGPRMLMSFTRFILSTFITIFLMYYLLISSNTVLKVFRDYFPISYKNSDILLDELGRQTKALIYGQLLISIIQGSFGAVGFFIFGISGALFWGLIMVIASFLPVFGASIVWFPAVIILIVEGEYINATGLFIWGAIVVGTIDNLIRPKLTEKLGKIHPVTVLLGVFIGIKEWGFIGVVIGPLMITVLLVLIKMFREEYLNE